MERNINAVIEAILFASGEPVTFERLGEVLELPKAGLRETLATMSEWYKGRGIKLVVFEDSCQLCTDEEYESYVKDALGIKKNGALSKTSLETLAIIAYHQPATRAYVEQVRGVDSSYSIGFLLQRGLIEPCGKLDQPGKPIIYSTTADFLRVFGLSSLDELPKGGLENEALTEETDVEQPVNE